MLLGLLAEERSRAEPAAGLEKKDFSSTRLKYPPPVGGVQTRSEEAGRPERRTGAASAAAEDLGEVGADVQAEG